MNKFHGQIGFANTSETSPGVWKEIITEKNYYGEILKNSKNWQSGGAINDDLIVSNRISIIADPFVYENIGNIRYVKFMGIPWKIKEIQAQSPRLILTLGGVYNGN
jgi:hypothetical protein